jgi:glycerate kinase
VACDVTTPFRDAATVFGPQKGASPDQVDQLTARLDDLASRYREHWGVSVDTLPGAGAAGGLAGGLAVLGARIVPGFDLVADLVGLDQALTRADLVITGEGHLDPPSFQGKVPGGVLERVAGRCAVVCIVGAADPDVLAAPPAGLEIISLNERFGPDRARRETVLLVAQVTADALGRFCP